MATVGTEFPRLLALAGGGGGHALPSLPRTTCITPASPSDVGEAGRKWRPPLRRIRGGGGNGQSPPRIKAQKIPLFQRRNRYP